MVNVFATGFAIFTELCRVPERNLASLAKHFYGTQIAIRLQENRGYYVKSVVVMVEKFGSSMKGRLEVLERRTYGRVPPGA